MAPVAVRLAVTTERTRGAGARRGLAGDAAVSDGHQQPYRMTIDFGAGHASSSADAGCGSVGWSQEGKS